MQLPARGRANTTHGGTHVLPTLSLAVGMGVLMPVIRPWSGALGR